MVVLKAGGNPPNPEKKEGDNLKAEMEKVKDEEVKEFEDKDFTMAWIIHDNYLATPVQTKKDYIKQAIVVKRKKAEKKKLQEKLSTASGIKKIQNATKGLFNSIQNGIKQGRDNINKFSRAARSFGDTLAGKGKLAQELASLRREGKSKLDHVQRKLKEQNVKKREETLLNLPQKSKQACKLVIKLKDTVPKLYTDLTEIYNYLLTDRCIGHRKYNIRTKFGDKSNPKSPEVAELNLMSQKVCLLFGQVTDVGVEIAKINKTLIDKSNKSSISDINKIMVEYKYDSISDDYFSSLFCAKDILDLFKTIYKYQEENNIMDGSESLISSLNQTDLIDIGIKLGHLYKKTLVDEAKFILINLYWLSDKKISDPQVSDIIKSYDKRFGKEKKKKELCFSCNKIDEWVNAYYYHLLCDRYKNIFAMRIETSDQVSENIKTTIKEMLENIELISRKIGGKFIPEPDYLNCEFDYFKGEALKKYKSFKITSLTNKMFQRRVCIYKMYTGKKTKHYGSVKDWIGITGKMGSSFGKFAKRNIITSFLIGIPVAAGLGAFAILETLKTGVKAVGGPKVQKIYKDVSGRSNKTKSLYILINRARTSKDKFEVYKQFVFENKEELSYSKERFTKYLLAGVALEDKLDNINTNRADGQILFPTIPNSIKQSKTGNYFKETSSKKFAKELRDYLLCIYIIYIYFKNDIKTGRKVKDYLEKNFTKITILHDIPQFLSTINFKPIDIDALIEFPSIKFGIDKIKKNKIMTKKHEYLAFVNTIIKRFYGLRIKQTRDYEKLMNKYHNIIKEIGLENDDINRLFKDINFTIYLLNNHFLIKRAGNLGRLIISTRRRAERRAFDQYIENDGYLRSTEDNLRYSLLLKIKLELHEFFKLHSNVKGDKFKNEYENFEKQNPDLRYLDFLDYIGSNSSKIASLQIYFESYNKYLKSGNLLKEYIDEFIYTYGYFDFEEIDNNKKSDNDMSKAIDERVNMNAWKKNWNYNHRLHLYLRYYFNLPYYLNRQIGIRGGKSGDDAHLHKNYYTDILINKIMKIMKINKGDQGEDYKKLCKEAKDTFKSSGDYIKYYSKKGEIFFSLKYIPSFKIDKFEGKTPTYNKKKFTTIRFYNESRNNIYKYLDNKKLNITEEDNIIFILTENIDIIALENPDSILKPEETVEPAAATPAAGGGKKTKRKKYCKKNKITKKNLRRLKHFGGANNDNSWKDNLEVSSKTLNMPPTTDYKGGFIESIANIYKYEIFDREYGRNYINIADKELEKIGISDMLYDIDSGNQPLKKKDEHTKAIGTYRKHPDFTEINKGWGLFYDGGSYSHINLFQNTTNKTVIRADIKNKEFKIIYKRDVAEDDVLFKAPIFSLNFLPKTGWTSVKRGIVSTSRINDKSMFAFGITLEPTFKNTSFKYNKYITATIDNKPECFRLKYDSENQEYYENSELNKTIKINKTGLILEQSSNTYRVYNDKGIKKNEEYIAEKGKERKKIKLSIHTSQHIKTYYTKKNIIFTYKYKNYYKFKISGGSLSDYLTDLDYLLPISGSNVKAYYIHKGEKLLGRILQITADNSIIFNIYNPTGQLWKYKIQLKDANTIELDKLYNYDILDFKVLPYKLQ